MINVNQITSQLAKMSDPALQKYAMMNKSDPYTVALALSESNRRKAMRQGAAPMPGQQPKVVDQDIAQMAAVDPMGNFTGALPENTGIGQIPAPNMQGMGKAEGGIVGYAEGGEVQHFVVGGVPTVPELGYEQLSKLYAKDPALAREAALRAGPVSQRILESIHTAARASMVPGAVLEGGLLASGKAAKDLGTYTTPEQRREMSSNPMLGAMSGDVGAAAATMDAKRNNPSGPSTTPYLTQMGNVAGAGINALGALGKHLISAPGYGFSDMPKPGQPEPGRIAMPQSTISGTGDTTEIDKLAAQMQAEKAKTSPTGGQPSSGAPSGSPTSLLGGAGRQGAGGAPAAGLDSVNSFANQMMGIDKFLPKKEAAPVEETFMKKREEASAPVWAKFESTIDKEKNRLNEGKEQDFYMALIEGGLAAAGGTSPSGLQNLAQGFSKGASSYKEALKDFRKASQENSKMELDMERAKAAEKRGDMDAFQKAEDSIKNRNADIDKLKTSGIFALQNVNTSGAYQLESTRQHVAGTIAAHGMPTGTERIIGQMPGKTFEEKLKAYSAVMGPEAKGDSATLIKYMSMNPAQKMQFKKENPQVAAALDAQLLTNTLRPVNVPNALP